jgi:hypothetical protein
LTILNQVITAGTHYLPVIFGYKIRVGIVGQEIGIFSNFVLTKGSRDVLAEKANQYRCISRFVGANNHSVNRI